MLVATIPTIEGPRSTRYCGVVAELIVSASGTAVVVE